VQASLYPQIKSYLANYAGQHKGKLISLQETVQDVTNDYLDTQSKLSNLLTEQKRLQTLMSQAQSLTDLLAIEQRLSDVEGQIEQINAHLAQLSGQTTFYSIQIELTPLSTYVSPTAQAWDPGGIFHDALASAKGFGEGLLTLLIWLVVYAVYIVPLAVISLLVVRYMRRRTARQIAPAAAPSAEPPTA
jgi:tetrahydromethanopterin S-methyltransferase subunit G